MPYLLLFFQWFGAENIWSVLLVFYITKIFQERKRQISGDRIQKYIWNQLKWAEFNTGKCKIIHLGRWIDGWMDVDIDSALSYRWQITT